MNLREKIRHCWHQIYYSIESDEMVEFAMKCQHVAELIDLKPKHSRIKNLLRFYLHLSLCQACSNYFHATKALKKAAILLVKRNTVQLDQLNKELIKKHARE